MNVKTQLVLLNATYRMEIVFQIDLSRINVNNFQSRQIQRWIQSTIQMRSAEYINLSKESLNFCLCINASWFIYSIELKDTSGNPLLGYGNDYGIYTKIYFHKSIHLEFTSDTRLEIKETGILGVTLMNSTSEIYSQNNRLDVLGITSEYRKDSLYLI